VIAHGRRLSAVGRALVVALALTVLPWPGPPAALAQRAEVTILIEDDYFLPSDITIPAGTTVTWINAGRAGHTTTSPGVWDSGPLAPGQRWSLSLAADGPFDYVSALQPQGMRGRIVVQAAPGAGLGDGSRGTTQALGGIGTLSPPTVDLSGTVGRTTSTALATLAPLGDGGVRGTATLLQSGDATTLVVSLGGLAPQTRFAGAIHRGSCDGPILFSLEAMVGDATGQGSASMTVNAALDPSSWWIEYHAASPPGPIACGPVRAAGSTPAGPDGSRCPERDGVAIERCQ